MVKILVKVGLKRPNSLWILPIFNNLECAGAHLQNRLRNLDISRLDEIIIIFDEFVY